MAPFFRWSLCIFAACGLGMVLFELLGFPVFKMVGWAHGYCYLRDPRMITLHVVSDSLIGAAYVSISATLAYIVYKASRDIPFNWVFLAFGLFIVSCGFTHFMEVWVVWQPVYWLSGYVKVVTAAASVATAIALFPLVPKIFVLVENAKQAEQKRLEIEQLNQELEKFNYSVAHDVRAPLRGILGLAQLLDEDYGHTLPADARRHLGHIATSAQKLAAMLEDLLRYSTVSRQEIELVPLDPRVTVASVLDLLKDDLKKSGGHVSVPENMPTVLASGTLLSQVFQNLIANSLKFVAPGVTPQVQITAEPHGTRQVRFAVSDNGLGIPEEHRDKVFSIFQRLHPHLPGTGIGLPLVQRSVERMNGQVGFESKSGQGGTTFWFTLDRA